MHGLDKNCESYAHTAYSGTIDHFRLKYGEQRRPDSFSPDKKQSFSHLIELATTRKLPADLESLPPFLQRLVPAALETMAYAEELPKISELMDRATTPELHREVYELVQATLMRASYAKTFKGSAFRMELTDRGIEFVQDAEFVQP